MIPFEQARLLCGASSLRRKNLKEADTPPLPTRVGAQKKERKRSVPSEHTTSRAQENRRAPPHHVSVRYVKRLHCLLFASLRIEMFRSDGEIIVVVASRKESRHRAVGVSVANLGNHLCVKTTAARAKNNLCWCFSFLPSSEYSDHTTRAMNSAL